VAAARPGRDWSSLPASWWDDAAFARAACLREPGAMPFVSLALRSDPAFVRSVAAKVALPAGSLPKVTATDRDLARFSVLARAQSLAAFPKLAQDVGFVSGLLADGFDLFEQLPDTLRGDRELARAALLRHPRVFEHLSEELRADKALALLAVTRSGYALSHASAVLRADREVVLAAVRSLGSAIKYASPALQGDRDLLEEAVLSDGAALSELPSGPPDDLWLRHLAVAGHRRLSLAGPLAADPEVVLDCLANNGGYGFEDAAEGLRSDVAFLRRVKRLVGLKPFEAVAPALRVALLGLEVETPAYRGRRVRFQVSPRSYIDSREQHVVDDVRVLEGDSLLVSAPAIPWLEFAAHGPVGSNNYYSAANGFALLGDFIFFHSARGLDGPRTVEHGSSFSGTWREVNPQLEDRAHELWLVDLPARGGSVTLTRTETLDDATGLHLLAKAPGRPHALAVSMTDGELDRTYRALSEFAAGDEKALGQYASPGEDGVLHLAPQRGEYARLSQHPHQGKALVDAMLKSGSLWSWAEVADEAGPSSPRGVACGGAACVWVDGFGARWLFPRPDGTYTWAEQRARLASTGPREDWEVLRRDWLSEATPAEREAVRRHFAEAGDTDLAAEVAAALAT
jgi:hypothetical protein